MGNLSCHVALSRSGGADEKDRLTVHRQLDGLIETGVLSTLDDGFVAVSLMHMKLARADVHDGLIRRFSSLKTGDGSDHSIKALGRLLDTLIGNALSLLLLLDIFSHAEILSTFVVDPCSPCATSEHDLLYHVVASFNVLTQALSSLLADSANGAGRIVFCRLWFVRNRQDIPVKKLGKFIHFQPPSEAQYTGFQNCYRHQQPSSR